MMRLLLILFTYFFLSILIACGPSIPDDLQQAYHHLPATLDFNVDVKPILSDKCFACHGPDKNKIKAGLQLHDAEFALAELTESPGTFAIVPGKLSKSEVFHRIVSDDPQIIMPPPESHLILSSREKAILIKWIKDGAAYKPHWAFIKPQKKNIPNITQSNWPKNHIDHFTLAKLEQNGWKPSEEADKQLLLRRLSLDLIGLPPTAAELEAFLQDTSEKAYERQVDRLLASPHYGERMASDWMDVARFADTHGYTVDRYRDMSPWRDWVIAAFNQNMPYDSFMIWQLAGDLLPNPTKEQKLATGFNRLHQQNMEGGIIDEEFRVEYVADRTSTLGTGMMALTIGCARCHDHKYDPISQKEYYELFSFFNQVNEAGQISFNQEDIPVPTMLIPTEEQEKVLAFLKEEIEKNTQEIHTEIAKEKEKATSWLLAQQYQHISRKLLFKGLTGKYTLDGHLRNTIGSHQGKMDRAFVKNEQPTYDIGRAGQGLTVDGDIWLNLHPKGIFTRSDPFSIGLWVNIPKELTEGVIFHKCEGAALYNFKGYHLYLKDSKLEMMMAHTAPDNAIIESSLSTIPKGEWVHLMMTYDGSSKADGLKLFINGEEEKTEVVNDQLYKAITFGRPLKTEPGLSIGGRWRGRGIKGAIVNDIMIYDRTLSALEVMMIGSEIRANELIAKPFNTLTQKEQNILREFYVLNKGETVRALEKTLKKWRRQYADSIEKVKEVMVMRDMNQERKTYILERGLYDAYGEEVFPNTPDRIFPFSEAYPNNRLGLAQWLVHPDHPLTARVAVNRYWQLYFGRGIVRTSEDFGNQGELPSHPDLLDWLAVQFIQSGWDVKGLQKLIVMSATYRQQSIASEKLLAMDPDNRLLARGPAVRLTSEMIRDNALFASGLLNKQIGGVSVKPYQPEGLWQMTGATYKADTGDKLYRRSLYTFWRRTVPHPTLSTFDQPERSECTVRRQKTNTPLQALALLNDPTFVEACKKIGENIAEAEHPEEGIRTAFLQLTGRDPQSEELDLLMELRISEYQKLKDNPTDDSGWLSTGQYQVDPSLASDEVTANAIVASVIINSDAAITKR